MARTDRDRINFIRAAKQSHTDFWDQQRPEMKRYRNAYLTKFYSDSDFIDASAIRVETADAYAAIESVTALSIVMGCAVGALACALLVINNLRDIPTDRDVGKRTLAVRLGDQRTSWFYVVLIALAFVLCGVGAVLVAWFLVWQGRLTHRLEPVVTAVGLFWFFVVAVWPVLYVLVYLW